MRIEKFLIESVEDFLKKFLYVSLEKFVENAKMGSNPDFALPPLAH